MLQIWDGGIVPVGTQRLSLRFYGSARGCGLIQNCGPPPSTAPQIMPPRHVAASMRFGACELALHEGLLPAPLGTPPGALRRSRPQRLASQVPVLNSDSERRAPAPQHRASGRAVAERAVPCAGRWQRRARLGDRRLPRPSATRRRPRHATRSRTCWPTPISPSRWRSSGRRAECGPPMCVKRAHAHAPPSPASNRAARSREPGRNSSRPAERGCKAVAPDAAGIRKAAGLRPRRNTQGCECAGHEAHDRHSHLSNHVSPQTIDGPPANMS